MQFRIYDRQTLAYKDGGYVAGYTIDDDYIVNNNSTITIVKELNDSVIVGDIIALIDTSGAYHKGVITTFDNSDFKINYKSDKELFNDNMLNPLRSQFLGEDKISVKFDLDNVASILVAYFANANDNLRRLPIKVITEGENDNMLWSWSNDEINIVDWLVEMFEKYNVSLYWDIDFNIANALKTRKPQYIVTLSAVTNSGKIIKDNVANQTITYTQRELPNATVCAIIDSDTKEIIKMSQGKNLLNPANATKNKKLVYENGYIAETNDNTSNISGFITIKPNTKYSFSVNKNDGAKREIVIYKKDKSYLASGQYELANKNGKYVIQISSESEDAKFIKITYYNGATQVQFEEGESATAFDEYEHDAIYYLANNLGVDYVTLDSNDKHRMLPVKMVIKTYKQDENETTPLDVAEDALIPSKFNQSIEIKISADSKTFDFGNAMFGDLYKIINEQGIINSNYTGRKEESGDKWITLYFGLGRQKYTDLVQMRMRKAKYQQTYNQGN